MAGDIDWHTDDIKAKVIPVVVKREPKEIYNPGLLRGENFGDRPIWDKLMEVFKRYDFGNHLLKYPDYPLYPSSSFYRGIDWAESGQDVTVMHGSGSVSQKDVDAAKRSWGVDSPIYRTYSEGTIPLKNEAKTAVRKATEETINRYQRTMFSTMNPVVEIPDWRFNRGSYAILPEDAKDCIDELLEDVEDCHRTLKNLDFDLRQANISKENKAAVIRNLQAEKNDLRTRLNEAADKLVNTRAHRDELAKDKANTENLMREQISSQAKTIENLRNRLVESDERSLVYQSGLYGQSVERDPRDRAYVIYDAKGREIARLQDGRYDGETLVSRGAKSRLEKVIADERQVNLRLSKEKKHEHELRIRHERETERLKRLNDEQNKRLNDIADLAGV